MIIVKKIRKSAQGHHGGAWKVAYADFVTAMMAFFLLLWLLNAVSQEQLEGISDYFAPITTQKSTSGGGGLLQGRTIDTHGVFNAIERQTYTFAQYGGEEAGPEFEEVEPEGTDGSSRTETRDTHAERRESAQFAEARDKLREAIASAPELSRLSKSLLIDETPEGLRIQIVDQDGLPMFPRGSSVMHAHTEKLLDLVADVIANMPQRVEITGHTDAIPFQGAGNYTNWELSADRANSARRVLLRRGVTEQRIDRITGKAATAPLLPKDPTAPGNRRLSVVLLRGTG